MREGGRGDAGDAPPARRRGSETRRELRTAAEIVRPLRRRNLGHAAEQPPWWARAQEHEAVAAKHDEGRAAAQPPLLLRRLHRKRLAVAARARGARAPPGTQHTGPRLRRADGPPAVHHRLLALA